MPLRRPNFHSYQRKRNIIHVLSVATDIIGTTGYHITKIHRPTYMKTGKRIFITYSLGKRFITLHVLKYSNVNRRLVDR
jgi:hypothetical protein